MNSHEFYSELKHLTELGYLEQAQLDRIRAEYIKTRKESRNIFLIFALLGVSLTGAGIISLFAYNWSVFSREMKAFISFLPLLGVQGLLYVKVRARASEPWIQSLALALGIAFLSALGLIYQAYQISSSLESIMMTGFLVTLPAVYLLDGYYLAVLYMAGICWTGGTSDYTLLVLLLLPYYAKRVREGKNSGLLSLCLFIWTLYLGILYVPYYAFYACVLILLIDTTIEKPSLYRKLAGRLLYVMLFLKAAFYLPPNRFDIFENWSQDLPFLRTQELLLLALLCAAAVRMYGSCGKKKGRKNTEGERLGLLLYGILGGLLVTDLILYQWTYNFTYMFAYDVLVNLSLIAYSLYRLLCGVKLADLGSIRRYTAAIILYIVLKVCLGNYELLVKGTVFLISGAAFLAVNYGMAVKLRGVDTHEDPAE